MHKQQTVTLKKLAGSLTAESTDLIPFLPYLLQDLWELGASPKTIVKLVRTHITHPKQCHFLDLACGKGAVSITLAQAFQTHVIGIDIIPDFIDSASKKVKELHADALCTFTVADANLAVQQERGYDCVIFGAAGDILGKPEETLTQLSNTVHEKGFIIIDDGYINHDNANVMYNNYDYLTKQQWLELFDRYNLQLLEEVTSAPEENSAINNADLAKIRTRAIELAIQHPEKKDLFESYVASQANEGHDLETTVTGVTWILRKIY